jgi:hypothetical protein
MCVRGIVAGHEGGGGRLGGGSNRRLVKSMRKSIAIPCSSFRKQLDIMGAGPMVHMNANKKCSHRKAVACRVYVG